MRPHLPDGGAFVIFAGLRTSRSAPAVPPSVRAPIEAALAKGMMVLTGDGRTPNRVVGAQAHAAQDQEHTLQPDKPLRASAWSPNDWNPSRCTAGVP
ncbi:hypothetical protein AV521_41890 [Streptomyces sp. IMTB 2501]|nr:hypothetical protein AV521_41890 [Streptomyces sp. IMTB 2501]